MKILSITAQKPHSTGSGTYLTELVRSWDRAGHKQAVVCGIFPEDIVEFPEGITCYPVFFRHIAVSREASAEDLFCSCKTLRDPSSDIPFPVVGMSDIMPYESTLYRDLTPGMIARFEDAFIRAAGRAVEDLDPDIIVCHHLFLLTALMRKHFPDRRILGISHGTDLRQMVNCDNLRDIVRPYIAGLDGLLALHDDQKTRISEIFGVSTDSVRVIGSGYNDALFNTEGRIERADLASDKQTPAPVRICYAGKMSRPKGVPELLRVLSELAADPSVPEFEVTLAGGCRDDSVMEELGRLPDNITWLGQIPQAELAGIFRSNDIFVLPSYFEGLPLVLIEAMASGMVPVSTDLPGVRQWVDANVPGSNVRYIPMPELASVDEPTADGREGFARDLRVILGDVISGVAAGILPGALPDTTGITWDSVAARILAHYDHKNTQ